MADPSFPSRSQTLWTVIASLLVGVPLIVVSWWTYQVYDRLNRLEETKLAEDSRKHLHVIFDSDALRGAEPTKAWYKLAVRNDSRLNFRDFTVSISLWYRDTKTNALNESAAFSFPPWENLIPSNRPQRFMDYAALTKNFRQNISGARKVLPPTALPAYFDVKFAWRLEIRQGYSVPVNHRYVYMVESVGAEGKR